MIGNRVRKPTKRYIDAICKIIAKTGIHPHIVTFSAIILAAIAAYFLYAGSTGLAFLFILLAAVIDGLDGAIARAAGKTSRFGNYFDAMVDRYVEIIVLLGFALAGYPILAFIAITGGMLSSYAKARAAVVTPIENTDWPSFGDRFDKFLLILLGIFISFFTPTLFGVDVIALMLVALGVLNHIGVIQRMVYAKHLIEKK